MVKMMISGPSVLPSLFLRTELRFYRRSNLKVFYVPSSSVPFFFCVAPLRESEREMGMILVGWGKCEVFFREREMGTCIHGWSGEKGKFSLER